MNILMFFVVFLSSPAFSENCTNDLFEEYHGEYNRGKDLYPGDIGVADSYTVQFFTREIPFNDYIKMLKDVGYSINILNGEVSMPVHVLDLSGRGRNLHWVDYFFNAEGRSISIGYIFVSHDIAADLDRRILGRISKCLAKEL